MHNFLQLPLFVLLMAGFIVPASAALIKQDFLTAGD